MLSWIIFPFRVIGLLVRLVALRIGGRRERFGLRLAKQLEKRGPSYIKLGQILSVRPDIVGEDVAAALTSLQDSLPPEPFSKVKRVIERQLKGSLSELFHTFDPQAKNAASIAQVYKAQLHTGEEIAVKVLRSNVARAFMRDIDFFHRAAKLVSIVPRCKRLRLVEVVRIFKETVKRELDLRLEAASASQLAENCKDDPEISVPIIYWQYTTESVLCSEWIHGTPIANSDALEAAGHSREQVAQRLIVTFLNQSYRDGFFHADLHPGNLFVNAAGQITPVDFGIMGYLDYNTRIFVAEILRGFLIADYRYVAKVHFDAGYIPKDQSMEAFALACRMIGEPIFQRSSNEVSVARLLALLFKVTEDFQMETQPQLLLLQKTLMTVEGVSARIYPGINMWQVAQPWIEQWAVDNLSPKAQLKRTVKDLAGTLKRLPSHIERSESFITDVSQHGLRLHDETVKALAKAAKPKRPMRWLGHAFFLAAGIAVGYFLAWQ
jgi:ubiquinone biosynthesis protein